MKAKHYPLLLLIVFIGLAAYSNSFSVPFQFDDNGRIVNNHTIRDLGNFISSFDASGYNKRRFIGYLTFALNYYLGGLNTAGYHAVNLAIHILNAVLVYFLVVLTFRTPYFVARGKRNTPLRPSQEGTGGQRSGSQAVDEAATGSTTQPLGDSRFTTHLPQADPPLAGGPRLIAFFSALFFVSHPIQTQAVTYIVQRFTSLATFFYLLSLVMYIKGRLTSQTAKSAYRESNQYAVGSKQKSRFTIHYSLFTIIWYLLSALSAVLAMKTKEIAFTLPVVIFLYEFLFFESRHKTRRLFFAAAAAVIAIPVLLIGLGGLNLSALARQTMVQAEGSRWVYFITEIRVIVTYLRLIFLPINQNIDYDYTIYRSFFAPQVFLSFLFLSAIFGAAVWLTYRSRMVDAGLSSSQVAEGERNDSTTQRLNFSRFTIHDSRFTVYRLIAFGILWFFITISIESSIIPIADVIFEHRVYLPSVGAFIALISAVFLLTRRSTEKAQKAVIAGLSVIVVVLSCGTYLRNDVWRSPITLWADASAKSPGRTMPLFSLGDAYARTGRYEEAIEMYRKALRIPPKEYLHLRISEYPKAYNALGLLYSRLGRYDEAVEAFRKILQIDPDFLSAYNNMGAAYISSGRYGEAIKPLKRVIEKNPDNVDAHYNLSMAYLGVGDRNAAMKEYVVLKRLSPEAASELARQIMSGR